MLIYFILIDMISHLHLLMDFNTRAQSIVATRLFEIEIARPDSKLNVELFD